MIDTMAERYGLLPSEVLARASTMDLYVVDVALSYREYRDRISSGKIAENYTAQELQQLMEKVRG